MQSIPLIQAEIRHSIGAYDQAALTQEELNNAYLEIENARQELTTTKQELQDIVGIRTDIIGALQSAFSNSSMNCVPQKLLCSFVYFS